MGALIFQSAVVIIICTACDSPTVSPAGIPSTSEPDTGISVIMTSPQQPTLTQQMTSTPSQTPEPSMTFTPVSTQTSTNTPFSSPTKSPTQSSTPSITPTYAILRGTVLEQSNCRYGPGAAYLYKYGLYPGNNLEIIGRNKLATWILVQAIGGNNPCWIKASLMDIHGQAMSLAPASLPLPQSPYYGPLTGVSSKRSGTTVTVSWNPIPLRAGDDSLQFPYLIEAWVCQGGQFIFEPIGSWETIAKVQDEPGCTEPSHARIYGVEKHGYTNWVTIPWTQP